MKILYIDTSSSYLYTGIVEKDKLLYEIKKELGHSLSEYALLEIVSMFKKTNIKPDEIEKIIVVNGPGSFTGIRIGVTIAKVYAWTLNIDITTITSLEAMMISSKTKGYHIPMIDARRGFVYSAIYDENNQEVQKPQHIELSSLLQKCKTIKEYTVVSNDKIEQINKIEKYDPDILKIVNYYKDRNSINPHAINPNYLKLTEAEENNSNDKSNN